MGGGVRCVAGKIRALVELIADHPDALAFDWRSRFGVPLSAIGDDVSWGEAFRLAQALTHDPTSRTFAAVHGWRHPFSHEARILADLVDLTTAVNTRKKDRKRIEPYPRPFPIDRDSGKQSTRGRTGRRKPRADQATIRATLAARGPQSRAKRR